MRELPNTPEWPRIVSLLASARSVHVASFQVGRFLGMGFATFLQTLRPRVHFAEGADGSIDYYKDGKFRKNYPRSVLQKGNPQNL